MISATAKGRTLQNHARKCFEAQGARVETARNVVRWIPRGPEADRIRVDAKGRCVSCHSQALMIPQSVAHDFFEIWDGVAVWGWADDQNNGETRRRHSWYQVTTLDHLAHRRAKILTSGFPTTSDDMILAWVGGRGRHFRVFRGPLFSGHEGSFNSRPETMKPAPMKRRAELKRQGVE